jgi:hypothetical protein
MKAGACVSAAAGVSSSRALPFPQAAAVQAVSYPQRMDQPLSEVATRDWGEQGGTYSPDGRYRWSYTHRIGDGPTIVWIGLNPGTGDREGRYRPTLQRMVDRSVALGMGQFTLVNLFAWRATRPRDLMADVMGGVDIVGPDCDKAIEQAVGTAQLVVVAWGTHGWLLARDRAVARLLKDPLCLGTTSRGQPRHPLYVRATAPLIRWMPAG